MEVDPGGFEAYSRGKALVVLYDFHALLFPGSPVHVNRLEEPVQGYEFVPRDSNYPPEASLTERGLAVMAKVAMIRQQFRGMLSPLADNLEETNVYDLVIGLCEDARLGYHAEGDLIDETGRPMASYEILPPPQVIHAMVNDFVLHRRMHCEPLEEYIAQLQSVQE